MKGDISAQDRSYRRGLVLGFTLAEVMVLIIFALLLALSWHLAAKEKEIVELSQSLKEKEAAVAKLAERTKTLKERVARGDDFDDLFRELELAKKQQAAQEQENATLREKVEALEEKNKTMEEHTLVAEKAMEIAREAGVPTENPLKALEKIASRLEQLEKVEEGLKAAGLDDSQVEEFVEKTLDKLGDTEQRAETLEGQLRNVQKKLDGFGKGTEKPACWASRETGKSEYIFNAALTSRGIIIRDNALPHRAEEQSQLPLQAIVFENEVRPRQFQVMTKPVFEWSVKEGCRFFVRVFDLTKNEEKRIYKHHLRIVGEHFYPFEDLKGTFGMADDRR